MAPYSLNRIIVPMFLEVRSLFPSTPSAKMKQDFQPLGKFAPTYPPLLNPCAHAPSYSRVLLENPQNPHHFIPSPIKFILGHRFGIHINGYILNPL